MPRPPDSETPPITTTVSAVNRIGSNDVTVVCTLPWIDTVTNPATAASSADST